MRLLAASCSQGSWDRPQPKFFLAGEPAADAAKLVTERSWDEQVADLQQLGETSLVGRSKHRAPATRA